MHGQVLGQKIIPGVAGRNLDEVADAADVLDRFFQEQFYVWHGDSGYWLFVTGYL